MDQSLHYHEGKNTWQPFVQYYLGILMGVYNDFEDRVEHMKYIQMSKPNRIRAVLDKKAGKITKKGILDICPDISQVITENLSPNW